MDQSLLRMRPEAMNYTLVIVPLEKLHDLPGDVRMNLDAGWMLWGPPLVLGGYVAQAMVRWREPIPQPESEPKRGTV